MIKREENLNTKTLQFWLNDLKSNAFEQGVTVEVEKNLYKEYQLLINTQIKYELDKLFLKILDFTPASCKIRVNIDSIMNDEVCVNTLVEGVDLFRISEILFITQLRVDQLTIEGKNTLYQIFVPSSVSTHWKKPLNFSPYYIELNKSLRSHFIESSPGVETFKTNQEHDNFLRRINKLLELHLTDENFGVIELSIAMHMSRTHLYRKIKKITSKSPLSYIMLFRLELAKQLLINNDEDLSISEVGYSCGFLDKSHFSRSFKKYYGVTPSNFRYSHNVT